jgi:hypothetical protein
MQDAAEAGSFPVSIKHVEAIVPGVPAVDDDRELRGVREFHLPAEDVGLYVSRGVVVEIVETDFAPGDDFWTLREARQFMKVLCCGVFGFVGVDADARINPLVLFGIWQSGIELFRARTGAYGENCVHTGLASSLKHGIAIFSELRKVNVRVRVDQVHGVMR